MNGCVFLDDDDLSYLPDKLERQIRYLKSNPTVDALGGALIMVRSDGRQAIWGGTYTGRLALSDALLLHGLDGPGADD